MDTLGQIEGMRLSHIRLRRKFKANILPFATRFREGRRFEAVYNYETSEFQRIGIGLFIQRHSGDFYIKLRYLLTMRIIMD